MRIVRPTVAALAALAITGLASACTVDEGGGGTAAGGGDDGGGGGSIEPIDSLEGADITVGSKEFDEQLVLGQIALVALEAAGAEPEDQTNITGTDNVRRALTSGEIDLYWEYTGTAWVSFLQQTETVAEPEALFEEVKAMDAENGVTWWARAPGNNTYAIAANPDAAAEHGIESISDYAALAQESPAEAATCMGSEFRNRDDGFPGVEEAYGFSLPDEQQRVVQDSVVYTELGSGETCSFGSVATTDGRIPAQDLVVLEDDEGFFPIYNPAITISTDVAEQYPELEQLFAPIAEQLDDESLLALNEQVSVEGEDPRQVATDWLTEEGFIG